MRAVRLLITGGLGFIGSHVVTEAVGAGHEVTVFDNRTLDEAAAEPDCEDLPVALQGARVICGDVRDASAVAKALPGHDAVLHLAAKVGLGNGVIDAADYVSSNDLGTAVLLSAMDGAGIGQFVLSSSMVVYGEGLGACEQHGPVPPAPRLRADLAGGDFESRCPRCSGRLLPMLITEDAPLAPANVYAASKLAQENLANAWVRATGGTAVGLRYHNVYGRRLPRDTPYAGVAALFVSMLRNGIAPTVYEDGAQRRDFVHVRDVARSNIAALGVSTPETMVACNAGSGTVRTVLDLAAALAVAANGPEPVVTGHFRLGDVRHITASSDRARSELHWQAREDFDAGMAELSR